MACSATDIPNLQFPRDEIIEIIPASYNNSAKRIHIPGLDKKLVPGSPEGVKHPAPPSGTVSPFSGIGTPVEPGSGSLPLRIRQMVTSSPRIQSLEELSGASPPTSPPVGLAVDPPADENGKSS